MRSTPSLDLLQRFHDRHAGASADVFGGADCGDGRPSYDHLADVVPDGAVEVLDLACGDGPLLARLVRPGRRLVGLDASIAELGAARSRGLDVELVHGLAQELPFADGRFDVVVSHMALMLLDEVEAVLAEVRRVLRPDGTFAFVVGRRPGDAPRERPIWDWLLARWKADGLAMKLGDPRWRDADGIAGLLGDAFPTLAIRPLNAVVRVPADGLFGFLEAAYYPIDAMSPSAKADFGAWLGERAAELAPAGRLEWRFELNLGVAR